MNKDNVNNYKNITAATLTLGIMTILTAIAHIITIKILKTIAINIKNNNNTHNNINTNRNNGTKHNHKNNNNNNNNCNNNNSKD